MSQTDFSMRLSALFQRSVISVQRLALIFFLLFTFYLLSSGTVSAQSYSDQPTNTYNQTNSYATPNNTSDVPKNLHFYTQNVMIEVMSSMICQLSGTDPTNPDQPCLGIDSKTGKIGFDQKNGGGAIGVMGKYIGDLFVLPVHTGDYINYLTSNFGISKSYAANGIGFTGLSPFAKIWSSFRDVVYLFFVIIFVLVGMAIMFRMKIDPRTVMTVENQIPKIITNIILVTLSFAISGFLIDMMYITIYTTTNIITSPATTAGTNFDANNAAKIVQSEDVFSAADIVGNNGNFGGFAAIPGNAAGAIGDSFQKTWFGGMASDLINGIAVAYLANAVNNLWNPSKKWPSAILSTIKNITKGSAAVKAAAAAGSAASTNPISSGVMTVIDLGLGATTVAVSQYFYSQLNTGSLIYKIIIEIILLLALTWALFRLWFALLGAYVSILFHVVLAPFMIFFGVIPGSSIGFGSWIKGIISNLLAFPVTIIMFLLGGLFIQIGNNGGDVFSPPLVGNTGGTNALGSMIGLAIIFMTPQVVKMMQELFKSEGFKYASAVGQAIGVGQSMVSGTGTAIYSPYGALHNFGRFREEGGLAGLFSAEARARARARFGTPRTELPKHQ